MPYRIPEARLCLACPYGHCVSYIREQSKKMKDRDTQYRLAQNKAMACCFSDWIPGGPGCPTPNQLFDTYLHQLVENAKSAGKTLEQQRFFGDTERAFFLTEAQGAKVRGDVFEVLCRAILWNICIDIKSSASIRVATLTLGDNYDLRKLFSARDSDKIEHFITELAKNNISLSYPTPDLICLNIESMSQEIKNYFTTPIKDLSIANQEHMQQARAKLEGHIHPDQFIFACGLKTSIRSDRMYQFLFEANAWKYIWRHVFKIEPCPYYTIMSRSFGADPEKLRSVDFSNPTQSTKAIDGVTNISTPDDLKKWFLCIIQSLTS